MKPYRAGFFFFEPDQKQRTSEGENYIQFYTGNNARHADDSPPEEVYVSLRKLLEPEFGNKVDIGAAESLHMIYCPPKQHDKVIQKVRDVLTAAGWKEGS